MSLPPFPDPDGPPSAPDASPSPYGSPASPGPGEPAGPASSAPSGWTFPQPAADLPGSAASAVPFSDTGTSQSAAGAAGPVWAPWRAPKPGVIPLRPLGMGEILDGAIAVVRGQPGTTLGLSAVVASVTYLLIILPLGWLASALAGPPAEAEDAADVPALAAADLIFLPGFVVAQLVVFVFTGVITAVVGRAVLGQRLSARGAWASVRPRIVSLMGAALLTALLVAATIAAVALVASVLAFVGGIAQILAIALLMLGVTSLLVYGYVVFSVAAPVIVLEEQRAWRGLRRSARLLRGIWWRAFAALVLIVIVTITLQIVLMAPFLVTLGPAALFGDDAGLLVMTLFALGSVAGSVLTWPFQSAATTLLYLDLRMRKEAFDLTLTQAAANAAAQPRGDAGDDSR